MDKFGSLNEVTASDSELRAGSSLRSALRNDRRHNKERAAILGVVAASCAAVLVALVQLFWGSDEWAGVMILLVTLAVDCVLLAAVAYRGVAVAAAAALLGSLAAGGLAYKCGLNWGFVVGVSVVPGVAAAAVMTSRLHRWPRTPAAVVVAAISPGTVLVAGTAAGGWVLLVSTVFSGAAVAVQMDAPRRRRVKGAAHRSNILMAPAAPITTTLLEVSPASGVDSHTIGERIAATTETAQLLSELGSSWYIFHSRVTPSGDVVDHVVVGPPGVLLVRSELVPGELRFGTDAPDQPWTFDGRPLGEEVPGIMVDVAVEVDALLMTPGGRAAAMVVIVAHGSRMNVDYAPQSVNVADGVRDVQWVRPASLVMYLRALTPLGRSRQFVSDLAAVVDYLLPKV